MTKKECIASPTLAETKSQRLWLQYPSTVIHIFIFCCNLLLFHPLLLVARLFGERALDWVMNFHCLIHLFNIRLTGARYTIQISKHISPEKPLILVSNHQAMYDIPLIIWNMKSRRPKFISKKESASFIPSISFALRRGGHLLIDRNKKRDAIRRIQEFGKAQEAQTGAICIFPEGTRSPNGAMRPFKAAGVISLLESMPNAQIIPVTVDGTGAVVGKQLLPIGLGARILLHIHDPLNREGKSSEEIVSEAESTIQQRLEMWRKAS